jgi:hypothetical protein
MAVAMLAVMSKTLSTRGDVVDVVAGIVKGVAVGDAVELALGAFVAHGPGVMTGVVCETRIKLAQWYG